MKSTLTNMVFSLLAVTLVASLGVGVVYRITAGPIATAKAQKVTDAIAQVLPAFDNDPSQTVQTQEVDGESMQIYTGMKGDSLCGYAMETFSPNGFGGMIRLMVGFLPDGTIYRVETLSQNETPGLGDKMDKRKSDFSKQFDGKNPANFNLTVKKDGGEVDALTAATISSRAYCDALSRAYKLFQTLNGKEQEHD